MQKFLERGAAVLGRVIFIGFSIQVALGILWMCNAFVRLDGFGEGIVCVGQMVALWAAVACLRLQGRGIAGELWTALGVITFPMVMQCLMTPDVRVLAAALLLAQTGCVLRAMNASSKKEFLFYFMGALCLWLAAGLIRGEYLYFGMFPAGLCLLYLWRKGQQGVARLALAALGTAGIIWGAGSFYQGQADMMAHMVSRVSWTTLYASYAELPEEWKVLVDYDSLVEGSCEVTGIEDVLIPDLEDRLGEEDTRELLGTLMAVSWRDHKGRIVKEMAWDVAGYTLTPLVLPMQLQGRAYDSYSGFNYRQILLPAPRLGKLYMDYGCWWFAVALLCCVLRGVMLWRAQGRGAESDQTGLYGQGSCATGFGLVLAPGTAVLMAVVYTMEGAGRMDYKNTLFILCVWLVWMAGAVGRNRYEDA